MQTSWYNYGFYQKPEFMMRGLVTLLVLILGAVTSVYAQSFEVVYSRLNQLPENKAKADSVLKYLSRAEDTLSARKFFDLSLRISSTLDYKEGLINSYDKYGVVMRNHSDYPQALFYHKKGLELAEAIASKPLKIQTLNNIGVVYRRLDDAKQALEYHMNALRMAEEINDVRNICISVNSIGNIYASLNQPLEALKCFKRSLPLEQKRGNLWGVAINFHNIGSVYESLNKLDSALIFYSKSLEADIKINKQAGVAICYNSIGDIYLKKKEYAKAIQYFKDALKINIQVDDQIYISVSYNNIGNSYLLNGKFKEAITYYQKGLSIAQAIGSKSQAQEAFEGLSKSYRGLRDFEKALDCYVSSVRYKDSITNENNIRHVAQIQAQYNTEKQQHQISILKKQKEASRLYIIILILIIIGIIVTFLLIYRTIIQKRRIAIQELDLKEQKIRELEKHHQLLATQAVLEGEETERSRLARDLHDGLGGLLSGVKLTLSGMKGNAFLSSDSLSLFEKALGMLDTSIKELRRVAHNMMPEALMKFGLKDALGDFCSSLENKQIAISYQHFGINHRFDHKIEISLYRIAQELINNAIKHSRATELMVHLIQEEKRVCLTVQDNGIGFNTNILHTSKGAGLVNIRSRAESLRGRFDLISEPDKGTEVIVEFGLQ